MDLQQSLYVQRKYYLQSCMAIGVHPVFWENILGSGEALKMEIYLLYIYTLLDFRDHRSQSDTEQLWKTEDRIVFFL